MEPLRISCDTCRAAGTDACDDCLVTFMCTRDADNAVVVQLDEWVALQRLAGAGLVPRLRHRATG